MAAQEGFLFLSSLPGNYSEPRPFLNQVTPVFSLNALSLKNAWLAIGVFDGVHRGHQQMLQLLCNGAHAESAPAVVLTFEPHPAVVLGKQVDFKWLSPPEERNDLLKNQGVDFIILQHFDKEFARISAQDFMHNITQQLGLRRLFVGHDFALGHNRQGNVSFLTEIGKKLGYSIELINPVTDQNGVISSTRIRNYIRAGMVEEACQDLGRLYSLSGSVVHGDGRGRTINIPTANLDLHPDKLIPTNGVYACWAWLAGERMAAVTNIGTRPTFTSGEQVTHVEAHILDLHEEIYGQELRLEFVHRLRDEQRFPSVDDLIAQIHSDIDQTRKILA
jgi:riboflavin kinase/FMN adenylyltransferase